MQKLLLLFFNDLKNREYKGISFWAKKARERMTRFILQYRIDDAEDLKAFDSYGYPFSNELCRGAQMVFTRDHK